ncbi:MAG: O-antigen ligase family protein [Fimbriimonadales bacterium]|nr:O-antigen ligase family protein [Fimbriimonadales bacterium]MDW8051106.1 O-antigen ligase family protein [Armatimonadota bacterium]
MRSNGVEHLGNGKAKAKPSAHAWMPWSAGLLGAGVALAPWWSGSVYVGARPIAPSDTLTALLWNADMPLMGAFVVSLLILAGSVQAAWHMPMWRVPVGRFLVPLVLLIGWLGVSAAVKQTGWAGHARLAHWLMALMTILSLTAIVRRNVAGWLVLSLMVMSASLIALRACGEYLVSALSGITNWRVFATFFNPNLLAGYLVMVAPLTMGLLLMVGREFAEPRRRLYGALLTVGLWLQLSALVLTASRLGMLSFVGAAAAFLIIASAWKLLTRAFLMRLAVVGVLLAGVLWLSAPATQRLTPQAAVQDVHSGAFRVETWKGALRAALANPIVGIGTGAFEWGYPRYASVGYTRAAHSTYLELAAESGLPALILLLIAGVGWLQRAAQREMPPDLNRPVPRAMDWRPVRVGVLAGVLGAVLHNAVDSDLQAFANLITLSALLGLGLALAVDGVYALPVRPLERRGIALTIALLLGTILSAFGLGEWFANQGRYQTLVSHIPQAIELYSLARRFDATNPDYLMDAGELYYALGRRETAFELMQRAVRLKPTARNLYRLGTYYEREGDLAQARMQFQAALKHDPHSLPALLKLAQLAQPDPNTPRLTEEARAYYERIIALQSSPYGRIRAIPQIVETAFGFAHLALARHYRAIGNLNQAQTHYEQALAVFRAYRELTYPFHLAGRAAGLHGFYNPERERQILSAHLQVLQELATLYEAQGRTQNAQSLRQEYARLSAE